MTGEDRLDAALEGDPFVYASSVEVQRLVDTGDEVSGALAAWTLDAETRSRLWDVALSRSGPMGLGQRLRALGLDRRAQAIAGGAVVTLAAATAVAVAIARGRRHAPASAALGA